MRDPVLRNVVLPALLAGVILGFGAGWVVGDGPDREIRDAAGQMALTMGALIGSCTAVRAENSYLVAIGVESIARADALGLLPVRPKERSDPEAE